MTSDSVSLLHAMFAGLSLADAQARLTTSTGIVGGVSCLHAAHAGQKLQNRNHMLPQR